MPPLPAALGVVKLEVMGDIAGNTYFANIFHLGGGEDPWSLSDLEALEGAMPSGFDSARCRVSPPRATPNEAVPLPAWAG